jgi:hypothetical protein
LNGTKALRRPGDLAPDLSNTTTRRGIMKIGTSITIAGAAAALALSGPAASAAVTKPLPKASAVHDRVGDALEHGPGSKIDEAQFSTLPHGVPADQYFSEILSHGKVTIRYDGPGKHYYLKVTGSGSTLVSARDATSFTLEGNVDGFRMLTVRQHGAEEALTGDYSRVILAMAAGTSSQLWAQYNQR